MGQFGSKVSFVDGKITSVACWLFFYVTKDLGGQIKASIY